MYYSFAFVGHQNHTNNLVCSWVESQYSCEITFYEPQITLSRPSLLVETDLDLILLDLNTVSGNAPTIVNRLSVDCEGCPILVLQGYKSVTLKQPIIQAGASGIISHTPSEEVLISAIDTLLNGDTFFSSSTLT